jgi:hypothetical protein
MTSTKMVRACEPRAPPPCHARPLTFALVAVLAWLPACSSSTSGGSDGGSGSSGSGSGGGSASGSSGSTQPCTPEPTIQCDKPGSGYLCPPGADASEDPTLTCSNPVPDPNGAGFAQCCWPWSYGDATCTPDDTITFNCPVAASQPYGYHCVVGATPDTLVPSLVCTSAHRNANGQNDFCCNVD